MHEWSKTMQEILDTVDHAIRHRESDSLTLTFLARRLGYSEYHLSRRFKAMAGMSFREFFRLRKLAFAMEEVAGSDESLLDIAVKYGFSSHEAFTRAFRATYGITPSAFRRNPVPPSLRTIIQPFDCYFLGTGGHGMANSTEHVKIYFVTIPAHKFLHIRNYESIGYFDFWDKQSRIPGCDCETICILLLTIPHRLDDKGESGIDSGSGQIMGYLNAPTGRICSWGIPLAECYGVRLPTDYTGPVPDQMILTDVPEGEYIVFEHGPFDYATENAIVEERIERAMAEFDYSATPYQLDMTPGRFFYFYHDEHRYWKYIRPVAKR